MCSVWIVELCLWGPYVLIFKSSNLKACDTIYIDKKKNFMEVKEGSFGAFQKREGIKVAIDLLTVWAVTIKEDSRMSVASIKL